MELFENTQYTIREYTLFLVSTDSILKAGERMMRGEYNVRTLEQADARTQSDSDKLKNTQDCQTSILDQNTHNLPHLTIFIVARSIRGTYIQLIGGGFECHRSHFRPIINATATIAPNLSWSVISTTRV